MLRGQARLGEHAVLGLVQSAREPGQLGPHLLGDLAPLAAGGRWLGQGGGDEGRDHAPAAPAGMGERVAHEVHPAPLSGGAEHRATAALMPSCASEMTSLTPANPRRFSFRRNSSQNASAYEAPIAKPTQLLTRQQSPIWPRSLPSAVQRPLPARPGVTKRPQATLWAGC